MTRAALLAAPLLAVLASAPETYNLDIAEKRITKEDFHASTALEARPGEGGIHIRAGASISARAIELVLRNVRGTVHFRADTSRLRDAARSNPRPTPAPASDQP